MSITASIALSIFQNRIVVAVVPRANFVHMGHEEMTAGSVVPNACDRLNALRILLGYMQNRVYDPAIRP